MKAKIFFYAGRCDDFNKRMTNAKGGLMGMVDNKRYISRRAFLSHVKREEIDLIASNLGYALNPEQGLTMASDNYIAYWKSNLFGRTVYGFDWSHYEYVFTPDGALLPPGNERSA